MDNFINELMGMNDDKALARKALESRAAWDRDAARDLVLLNSCILTQERMAAWVNLGEASFAGKSDDDKDETQRQQEEEKQRQIEAAWLAEEERQRRKEAIKQNNIARYNKFPKVLKADRKSVV